jgi:hypothetical protein
MNVREITICETARIDKVAFDKTRISEPCRKEVTVNESASDKRATAHSTESHTALEDRIFKCGIPKSAITKIDSFKCVVIRESQCLSLNLKAPQIPHVFKQRQATTFKVGLQKVFACALTD